MSHAALARSRNLLLLGAFFLITAGTPKLYAQNSCQVLFPSGSQVSAGYGAAWNVLTPGKELLLNGSCNGTQVTVTAGSGKDSQYIYNLGYFWNGTKWQQYTLTGARTSGSWVVAQAQGTMAANAAETTYFVGYVCQLVDNAWKCGCADAACATPLWQLQGVQAIAAGGGSTGGDNKGDETTTGGSGKKYYVDSSIADSNPASATPDCTTYNPASFTCGSGSDAAIATVADVNALALNPDETVLFRRGQMWRGQIVVQRSGTAGHPITFGAFGAGAKPILDGTLVVSGTWTSAGGAYSAGLSYTPNLVFQDGKPLALAASSASMPTGSYYYDVAGTRLYVRTTDGSSPSGRLIEASRYPSPYQGLITMFKQHDITIDNFDFRKSNYHGVYFEAGSNITISNNNFLYGYHNVVTSSVSPGTNPSNISVLNNTFAHNGLNRVRAGQYEGVAVNIVGWQTGLVSGNNVLDQGGEGIQTLGGPSNIEISNNLVDGTPFIGIYVSAGYVNFGQTKDITVKYNKVINAKVQNYAISLEGPDNIDGVKMFGNVADGSVPSQEGATCLLIGWAQSAVIRNVSVNNNTFYNCQNGIVAYGPTDATNNFKNNIINARTYVWDMNDNEANYSPDYDILSGSGQIRWKGVLYSLDSFKAAKNKMMHSRVADPLLVNPGSDYSLRVGSPAINAGVALGAEFKLGLEPTSVWPDNLQFLDQDANGSGWDIGAFVYPH